MKIAIYHELAFGGALRAAEAYAVELAKRHDVTLYSVTDTQAQPLPGVVRKTYHFQSNEPKGLKERLKHDFFDLIQLQRLSFAIASEINHSHADLVFVHPSRWTQAPFLLRYVTLPCVYYAQEALRIVYDDEHNKIDHMAFPNLIYEKCNRLWRKQIDARNIHAASRVIVNSSFTRENIRSAYGITSYVCHLGVNTQLFQHRSLKKMYDVLFFGSPVKEEGYDIFEAAQLLSSRPWKVVTLQRKLDGTGVSDAQLVRLINQSKIAISLEHHHPFGINMLEAGACGVAVIAANEGGYRDGVISGKTGLLVERTPKAVEQAVNSLLKKPAYCERLGKMGKERVLSYWTWEMSTKRLEKQFKFTLDTHTKSARLGQPHLMYTLAYVSLILGIFCILRYGFRVARSSYAVSLTDHGVIGYAQYTGYPLLFETYYFGFMFIIPILVALLVRFVWQRRHV